MKIFMVWKDADGKYDVLYFKPFEMETAYLCGQTDWWKEERYYCRTVEVTSDKELLRMHRYLLGLGYKEESQI